MKKHIAFLRAINVGGHNVKMEELKKLFERIGFKNVETFIASGNVIFETKSKNLTGIEKKIEDHLLKSLGYEVSTFIRATSDLAAITNYKPFKETELKSALALNVAFLKEPLTAGQKKNLTTFKTDIDDFHVNGKEVYWLCKKKQSESKFSNTSFERTLKVQATFRGMRTVIKLSNKYPAY